LVGVDHERQVVPDLGTDQGAPPLVAFQIPADLDLEPRPSGGQALAAQPPDFFVRIAEPAGRSRVGGVTGRRDLLDPGGPARRQALKHVPGLVGPEGVGEVPPVDQFDDLGRAQARKEGPERLALDFRPQVPEGVHDGGRGQVDDPLLGPQPAELAVARQVLPEGARGAGEGLDSLPDDERA
jgi:hypothetical protein